METRHALERAKIHVNLGVVGRGSGIRWYATPADGDGEGLEIVREVGEDEGVVRANLVGERVGSLRGRGDDGLWDALGVGDDGGHGGG